LSTLFPKIENLNDILPYVKDQDYIGVNKQSNGATVICYNISNGESFNNSFEKEARGITFDVDGKIISRPLHKFFNLAEREEVQPHNLDWNKMVAAFDKMDGSMITTGLINGEFFAKSKKSFQSDVAVSATAFVQKNQKYYDFTRYCALANMTPIFEFTSPNHRIVLRYSQDNMTLLHVRDNFTGVYLMPEELAQLASKYDIPVNSPVHGRELDLPELLKSLNTVEGIEGYVIQFENGEMVKVKTKWYVNLHHAVTFVRERDIARMVVEEQIDDYIAFVALNAPDADLTHIRYINDTIKAEVEGIEREVTALAKHYAGVDFKTVALDLKDHPHFKFVMNLVRGKTNNYLDYYERNRLREVWSLEQIDLGEFAGEPEEEA
jgi:RNA ligase